MAISGHLLEGSSSNNHHLEGQEQQRTRARGHDHQRAPAGGQQKQQGEARGKVKQNFLRGVLYKTTYMYFTTIVQVLIESGWRAFKPSIVLIATPNAGDAVSKQNGHDVVAPHSCFPELVAILVIHPSEFVANNSK